MATKYKLEEAIENAVKAYLAASTEITATYPVVFADGDTAETTPCIVVHAQTMESMYAGTWTNNISVEISVVTHADDDKDGSIQDGLTAAVRDRLRAANAVTDINSNATGVTVIGMNPESDAYTDEVGRHRVATIACEIIAHNE